MMVTTPTVNAVTGTLVKPPSSFAGFGFGRLGDDSSDSSIDWGDVITQSIKTTGSLLTPILAPQGTVIQTGPGGTQTLIRGAAGQQVAAPYTGTSLQTSVAGPAGLSSGLVIGLGLGIGALLLMSMRKN